MAKRIAIQPRWTTKASATVSARLRASSATGFEPAASSLNGTPMMTISPIMPIIIAANRTADSTMRGSTSGRVSAPGASAPEAVSRQKKKTIRFEVARNAATMAMSTNIAAIRPPPASRQYRRRHDEEGDNEGSGKTRTPATPVATLFPSPEGNRNSSEQADYNEPADAYSDRPSELRCGSDRGEELRENDR